MKIAALVPFKRLTSAKRRLRTELAAADVERISRAMLADVLEALAGSRSLASVRLLTADREVAELARDAGATLRLQDPDPGLNAAIDAATAELVEQGFDASLVVLGDLPLLEPAHVDAVLACASERQVVVVPSSDGGTAMLCRRPADCMPARFGKQSASVHESTARELGLDVERYEALDALVRVDLDTPEDIDRILQTRRRCRTVTVLEKLAR